MACALPLRYTPMMSCVPRVHSTPSSRPGCAYIAPTQDDATRPVPERPITWDATGLDAEASRGRLVVPRRSSARMLRARYPEPGVLFLKGFEEHRQR